MAGGAVDDGRIGHVFAVVCGACQSICGGEDVGRHLRIIIVQMLMKAKRAMYANLCRGKMKGKI